MPDNAISVMLTSGRTLLQGRGLESGKLSEQYRKAVSMCEMDSSTMEQLQLHDGDTVLVETASGSVVVYSKVDPRGSPGIVFIPAGPYANAVTGSDTIETGMPLYKSIPAKLSRATDARVLTLEQLIDSSEK